MLKVTVQRHSFLDQDRVRTSKPPVLKTGLQNKHIKFMIIKHLHSEPFEKTKISSGMRDNRCGELAKTICEIHDFEKFESSKINRS